MADAGTRLRWYLLNLDLNGVWHNVHTHAARWQIPVPPFLFHCHIEEHMMQGLAGLVRAREHIWMNEAAAKKVPFVLPYDGADECAPVDGRRVCKPARMPEMPGMGVSAGSLIGDARDGRNRRHARDVRHGRHGQRRSSRRQLSVSTTVWWYSGGP